MKNYELPCGCLKETHLIPCACFKCEDIYTPWTYESFDVFYNTHDMKNDLQTCDVCTERAGCHNDTHGQCQDYDTTKTYFTNAKSRQFRTKVS